MNEFNNPNAEKKFKNDAPSYTWQEVWTMVLTKPSTETFEAILRDPEATRRRAFNWVFVTGTIALVISQFVNMAMLSSYGYNVNISGVIPALACGVVLGGLIVVLGFAIGNGITQFIAKLLGGVGTYSEFYYASAAFGAPLIMINVAITAFGGIGGIAVGLVSIALSIYQLILTVMALKAVNQFGTGKALVTIFLPVIILFVIVFFVIMSSAGVPTRY